MTISWSFSYNSFVKFHLTVIFIHPLSNSISRSYSYNSFKKFEKKMEAQHDHVISKSVYNKACYKGTALYLSEPVSGKMYLLACIPIEDPDQPTHLQSDQSWMGTQLGAKTEIRLWMHRLNWIFTVYTSQLVHCAGYRLIFIHGLILDKISKILNFWIQILKLAVYLQNFNNFKF